MLLNEPKKSREELNQLRISGVTLYQSNRKTVHIENVSVYNYEYVVQSLPR
jgi:hypothetical protein